MFIIRLLFKSLWHRKSSIILSVFSISLSLCLILGIDKLKDSAQESFTNTISKTDLIVGEKGGRLQLLLYSLFHLGSPINNISYESFEHFSNHPQVKWTIPISLGDGHKGYRVVGTSNQLFQHYQFHGDQKLEFSQGHAFEKLTDVVIGSEVAKKLSYHLGEKIYISHGIEEGVSVHDHIAFQISGILKPSFTPMDKAVFVKLSAIEALHDLELAKLPESEIEIEQISSFLLAANSRIQTLSLQREIDNYQQEPLMAAIPGVELSNLWGMVAQVERVLKIISYFVILVSFLTMIVAILSSLNERRREIAILRAMGFSASKIFFLLITESFLIILTSCVMALFIYALALILSQTYFAQSFGIPLSLLSIKIDLFYQLALYIFIGTLLGIIPAIKAYRLTLQDGLLIRN